MHGMNVARYLHDRGNTYDRPWRPHMIGATFRTALVGVNGRLRGGNSDGTVGNYIWVNSRGTCVFVGEGVKGAKTIVFFGFPW